MLGSADYTATSGTTVVLNNGCTAGDLVETISFFVSSVLNAIPAVAGAVNSNYLSANLSMVTPRVTTTLGVGNATPATSGAGITFPATKSPSSDANTLDDYEEGTWTPSLGGTATYTSRFGTYTKVGNLVTVLFLVRVNSIGTGATAYVNGLPFIPVNMSSGTLPLYASLATSLTWAGCYAEPDGIIYLTGNTGAVSSTSINGGGTVLANGSIIYGAITFRI
jgi:hypothetical protein